MKLLILTQLILIFSSNNSFAEQITHKKHMSKKNHFQPSQPEIISEIDLVDHLIKKKSNKKNIKLDIEKQFNLNDCHLGESVFNSFAQVRFDLKNKYITYKEFDQNTTELIETPDLSCLTENVDHAYCRSEIKNISIHFFNIRNQDTEVNKSLMAKIRFAIANETLYANTIVGIIERPYFDKQLKNWTKRTDTLRCIQSRF